LLAVALTCAACDSDDDAQPDNGGVNDAGDGDIGKIGSGGRKPGFGMYHGDGGVLELGGDGHGGDRDGAVGPDARDGGVADGSGGSHAGSGGAHGGGDGGEHAGTPAPVVPPDPGVRGPWAVGVRTLQVDLGSSRSTPAEIWYPAQPASEAGASPYTYELADWLPPEARDMLPGDELPIAIPCDCYRNLPIDAEHGPYPVVIFSHAFGGARVEAVTVAAHWASRGFVVVAADHPGLTLADTWDALTGGECSGSKVPEDTTRSRDLPAILRALRDRPGDWDPIGAQSDLSNYAVGGRIGGAEFAATMNGTPGMRLMMLVNSSIYGEPEGDVAGILYLTGQKSSWYTDSYSTVKSAFNATKAYGRRTFLAGILDAASQTFAPYCSAKSAKGLDGEHLDVKYRFCGIVFGDILSRSDCQADYLSQDLADTVYTYVTTAALEEVLKDKAPEVAWAGFSSAWGELMQAR
jgi:hypothetical protein